MKRSLVLLLLAPLALVFLPRSVGTTLAVADGGGNSYIGVEKCKNCHEAKTKGSQYTVWKSMKHSHAWEALASDEAKKTAKEKGREAAIKDMQNALGK